MAVKIRLTRMGKKKQPTYRVVVVDSRKPRDGAFIEQIGRYDPRQEPSLIEIDNDRALDWLMKGAQPTETAQKLLEISGAWARFKVAKGEIYTVGEKAAPVVEEVEAEADAAATDEVEAADDVAAAEEQAAVEETAEEPEAEEQPGAEEESE